MSGSNEEREEDGEGGDGKKEGGGGGSERNREESGVQVKGVEGGEEFLNDDLITNVQISTPFGLFVNIHSNSFFIQFIFNSIF